MASLKGGQDNRNDTGGTRTVALSVFDIRVVISMPEALYVPFTERYKVLLPATSGFRVYDVGNFPEAGTVEIDARFGGPEVKLLGNRLTISALGSPEQFALDVIFAASRLLEREMNLRGMYSLHASGVSYGGRSLLLTGQGGSGKSTIALGSCLRDTALHYVSDERVVLDDGLRVVGASDHISLRNGSLLSELFRAETFSRVVRDKARQSSWDGRAFVNPSDLNLTVEKEFPLDVLEIDVVKKLPKPFVRLQGGDAGYHLFLKLYQNVAFFGEEVPPIVLTARLPFPGTSNEELRLRRVQFVERLMDKVTVVFLEGDMHGLTTYVMRRVRPLEGVVPGA